VPYIDPLTAESIRRRLGVDRFNPSAYDSGCVLTHSYDPETEEMTIGFQKRGTYKYFGVPSEEYIAFAESSSLGQYFNSSIRDSYSYERIG